MTRKSILFFLLIGGLILASCNSRVTDPNNDNGTTPVDTPLVEQVGTDATFEIATWNIEHFPKSGYTVNTLKSLIGQLDIDLIAVQEIENRNSFNKMLDDMHGWDGILNNYPPQYPNYQMTGIIYKSDMLSLSNTRYILSQYKYEFASRPPFAAYVQVRDKNNATVFDFNLIVVHLKAFEDGAERRKQSIGYLKTYIDDEITHGADSDFVVLGDWNDRLEDQGDANVFRAFLDDPADYRFLTGTITNQYSYLKDPYKNLIDHLMITTSANDEYGGGLTKALDLERRYTQYISVISDHRPVVSIFKGLQLQ